MPASRARASASAATPDAANPSDAPASSNILPNIDFMNIAHLTLLARRLARMVRGRRSFTIKVRMKYLLLALAAGLALLAASPAHVAEPPKLPDLKRIERDLTAITGLAFKRDVPAAFMSR